MLPPSRIWRFARLVVLYQVDEGQAQPMGAQPDYLEFRLWYERLFPCF